MKNLNIHANCASCKRGEIKAPADVFVQGFIVRDDRKIPYRGYLCDDHYELMAQQGDDELRATDINMDRITIKETAFSSFEQLCAMHHNPTLRNNMLRSAYNSYMAANKLPHRAYA